jgi:hypothetical protein
VLCCAQHGHEPGQDTCGCSHESTTGMYSTPVHAQNPIKALPGWKSSVVSVVLHVQCCRAQGSRWSSISTCQIQAVHCTRKQSGTVWEMNATTLTRTFISCLAQVEDLLLGTIDKRLAYMACSGGGYPTPTGEHRQSASASPVHSCSCYSVLLCFW